MTFFIQLLIIGLGTLLVVKTQWIYDFTGPIDFAEKYLGSEGGSRLFIKLMGVLMIAGSFLAMTGLLGAMVDGIFGSLLGRVDI